MARSSAPEDATRRLADYRARRDFARTPEPDDAPAPAGDALAFVIQKHDATRLHYDFRLQLDGVLLSWAVPKGPSLDPADKRMAVRTEDHPLAYAGFEGRIPPGQYGAGEVIVWDRGTWVPLGDPHAGLQAGKLKFELHGLKLRGQWELVRTLPQGRREQWLLFKRRDAHARARAEEDITLSQPDSVARRSAPQAAARPAPPSSPATPLPHTLSPQLAVLASALPGQGRWVFETKFDGYRLLAQVQAGQVKLVTRNGHDWTDRMPALARAVAALGTEGAWFDGEIVVPDRHGRSSFNALQNAFDGRRTHAIEYRLFDLPFFEGHDLRDTPLSARRDLLQRLLQARPQTGLAFSEALGEGGAATARRVLAAACKAGLEGIVAKRLDAPYRSARDASWLKLKCHARQEFVVGGYTLRSDDAQAVGSLILGVHDAAGRLLHAGSVGTGWDRKAATALLQRLRPLQAEHPPFAEGARSPGRWARRSAGLERWVRPRLVVEVEFGEWTPAGHVRHASFLGVRTDKPARKIVRESAQEPGVKVSHPDRVIDAASGATKLDLVHYYESVADFMLPHLCGRPVALVRAPGGVGQPTFFQKHGDMPGVKALAPALWPGHEALLEIGSSAALLAAAQMNVVEFHTWNSRAKSLMKPDRMVFDLDPGEGVAWPQVQEGALLVRALLDELGLPSWLKTSGGKGLHVVVPLSPRRRFDEVKGFSQAVVQHLARTIPQRFVARSGPKNRVGRIFVDYLRNGEGATTVAAFSARARPGLGVSMPVSWDELPGLEGGAHWNIRDARDHLSLRRVDPWADMAGHRPTLTAAMKRLGWKPVRPA